MIPAIDALERTAWHEAGHAVAAVLRHLPFRYVTIQPLGDALGHVGGVPFDQGRARDVRYCEDHLVMMACGPVAERMRSDGRGQRYNVGAGGDYRDIEAVLVHLVGADPSAMAQAHRRVWSAAEDLVREWRHPIDRVALALLERRTLVETMVRELCLGAA